MRSFASTRGQASPVSAKSAIWRGLAPDGGLFTPTDVSDLKFDLDRVRSQSYLESAQMILGAVFDDFSAAELEEALTGAYANNFSTPEVTPLSDLGQHRLLELYRGPTSAFKDVALTLLPYLLTASNPHQGDDQARQITYILTATSGDTGTAALEGFKDVPGTFITVFYPAGGVSKIQERQMRAAAGKNTQVIAVDGNFDDCQRLAKRCATDPRLAELGGEKVTLSSANSINAGRLFPQVVYYFRACAELAERGELAAGQRVDFAVPTGNFGNILAGYYAKMMGAPVGQLICASNENNVLTDFINTGVYDRRRTLHRTTSPSMDILVSSNLERLLYLLTGGDSEQVRGYMSELDEKGSYRVSGELLERIRAEFAASCAGQKEAEAAIRLAWEEHGVLIDPHTAVAYDAVAKREQSAVVLSTASAYKFPAAVLRALTGQEPADGFAGIHQLHQLTGVEVPANLARLEDAVELHDTAGSIEEAAELVAEQVRRLASGEARC